MRSGELTGRVAGVSPLPERLAGLWSERRGRLYTKLLFEGGSVAEMLGASARRPTRNCCSRAAPPLRCSAQARGDLTRGV